MPDGFYKVWLRDHWSVGELRTVDTQQRLFLIGYDESVNPEDFEIGHPVYVGKAPAPASKVKDRS